MTSPSSRAARLQELRPFVDEARQLRGWTLAYQPLPLGAPVPWDYEAQASALAQGAAVVLDMGTGGGEVFGRILAGQHGRGHAGRAVATEGWWPNVPVADRRLRSIGVRVVH